MRARKRGERWQSEAGDQGKGWAVAWGWAKHEEASCQGKSHGGRGSNQRHFQDKQKQ